LAIVALALADVAGDVNVGEEVHFDLEDAVALALLAAAALDVEGEAAWAVAAGFRFREAGEPFAQRREGTSIGGRVRTRGAADRRLIDVDDLVEEFEAGEAFMRGRDDARAVETTGDGLVHGIDHQGRLTAPGYAGDGDEH